MNITFDSFGEMINDFNDWNPQSQAYQAEYFFTGGVQRTREARKICNLKSKSTNDKVTICFDQSLIEVNLP